MNQSSISSLQWEFRERFCDVEDRLINVKQSVRKIELTGQKMLSNMSNIDKQIKIINEESDFIIDVVAY
jgi:hypothetical protein